MSNNETKIAGTKSKTDQIVYWNSRMKGTRLLNKENSNVTVRKYRCGCQEIHEHSSLRSGKELVRCAAHQTGKPNWKSMVVLEHIV